MGYRYLANASLNHNGILDPMQKPIPILEQERTALPGMKADDISSVYPAAVADQNKRVLFVMDTLNFGGTETQTVQMAVRLQSSGFHVAIACLHRGGPLSEALNEVGIKVIDFTIGGSLLSPTGFRQIFRLSRFIRSQQFDVVHAHDLWANLVGVPAARLAGTPLVVSSQRDLGHLWWYTPFRTRVIRLIHRLATAVTANSNAVRDFVVREFNVPEHRVLVIYNGVDVDRFASARRSRADLFPGIAEHDPLIAVLANMHSDVKGHHDLIDAAKSLRVSHPNARFVLIGDGEERQRIETHVREAQVSNMFLFLGKRKDIPGLLACCDLSVLASHAEGFPNAVLESMAAGLPVIATSVGGVPEIIEDGTNGVLVPAKAPALIAEAIHELLSRPTLASAVAAAGQEWVRSHYSFEQSLSELRRLYRTSSSNGDRKGQLARERTNRKKSFP